MKKALSEVGPTKMTSAESAWYIVLCICLGVGYFAKTIAKKALSEVETLQS
jgi:predicted methyltransferase